MLNQKLDTLVRSRIPRNLDSIDRTRLGHVTGAIHGPIKHITPNNLPLAISEEHAFLAVEESIEHVFCALVWVHENLGLQFIDGACDFTKRFTEDGSVEQDATLEEASVLPEAYLQSRSSYEPGVYVREPYGWVLASEVLQGRAI